MQWASGALLILAWPTGFWLWRSLPSVIPIHWSSQFLADGWAPSFMVAWLFPVVSTGIWWRWFRSRKQAHRPVSQILFLALHLGFYLGVGSSRSLGANTGFWLFCRGLAALLLLVSGCLPLVAPMGSRSGCLLRILAPGRWVLVAIGLALLLGIGLAPMAYLWVLVACLLLLVLVPVLVAACQRHRGRELRQALHSNDLLALFGVSVHLGLFLQGLLALGGRHSSVLNLHVVRGIPFVTLAAMWLLLYAEPLLIRPQTLGNAVSGLRGWVVLSLAIPLLCFHRIPIGNHALALACMIFGILAQVLVLGLGQRLLGRYSHQDSLWAMGQDRWDGMDPRVVVARSTQLGATLNFDRPAAWMVLVVLMMTTLVLVQV